MNAKSASGLPTRETSCIAECIAVMLCAKAASTGESDFSHEVENTPAKQSSTMRKRAEHIAGYSRVGSDEMLPKRRQNGFRFYSLPLQISFAALPREQVRVTNLSRAPTDWASP